MISFGPTEEQQLIRETVREFADSEMRSIARDADEASAVPDEFLEKTWELGLVNSAIPEEFGGGGMERSPITNALVLEELGYGCASLAAAALAPGLFVQPLLDFGTDAQKAEYLPLFTTSSFHASNYPQSAGDTLAMPKVLADRVGDTLRARGHRLLVGKMQQPYRQTPSGAGAVKMVMIDPETGVMFGGASPAKDDYVIGW